MWNFFRKSGRKRKQPLIEVLYWILYHLKGTGSTDIVIFKTIISPREINNIYKGNKRQLKDINTQVKLGKALR